MRKSRCPHSGIASPRADRRDFLKLASIGGAAPMLPIGASRQTFGMLPDAERIGQASDQSGGIYERVIGMKPVINASGPVTTLGGTLLSRQVTDAMADASRSFVDLIDLYDRAGARLAEITKSEAAMVTSGASAAMTLAAAACLTGSDTKRMANLPHPTWERRELVIQRQHSTAYDQAYRNAGMEIVYVDTEDEMRAAIGDRTAMIAGLINTVKMTDPGIIPLERLVHMGKEASVPVYFDASFAVTHNSPPASLWQYTQMGADVVGISGGKGLHGPQSTGILAGRADLIAAARAHASPFPWALGRGFKVDKEEVIGLLVAVEQFLRRDAAALRRRDIARVHTMQKYLEPVPGVQIEFDDAFFGPGLILFWDQAKIELSYEDFVKYMKESETPIVMLIYGGPTAYFVRALEGPVLYAGYLEDGEDTIVAERARDILLAACRK